MTRKPGPMSALEKFALTGKHAVVTGASRGIGRGIALALGERGATVYVTGRTVKTGTHPLPGVSARHRRESGRGPLG